MHIVCVLEIFAGNERDAASKEVLNQSKITHVLNVTSHIPQHFENDAGVTYKRLAASDSCSQNLKQYFEEAITFIGECWFTVFIHQLFGHSKAHVSYGIRVTVVILH